MALPSSGTISMLQVNNELGKSSTQKISLNDAEVRSLANKTSGTISMSDLYGKVHNAVKKIKFSCTSDTKYYGYGITRATFKNNVGATILDIYGGSDISGYVCPVMEAKEHNVYVDMSKVSSVSLRMRIKPQDGGRVVTIKILFSANSGYVQVSVYQYSPSSDTYSTANTAVNYYP